MNISNDMEIKITSDNLEIIKSALDKMNIPFELITRNLTNPINPINSINPINPISSIDQLNQNNQIDLSDSEDSFDILETDIESDVEINSDIKIDVDQKDISPLALTPLLINNIGLDLESSDSDSNSKNNHIDLNESDLDVGSLNDLDLDSGSGLEKPASEFAPFEKNKINENEEKITLNVGGKKFHSNKTLLERLNIKYTVNRKNPIYFLDRDPHYFSQIIEIIRKSGTDCDDIVSDIDEYSDQLISELCFYTLLDKKFLPKPKLKLKRSVGFLACESSPIRDDNNYNNIIKIMVKKQLFDTSIATLSRSTYFTNKIKLNVTNANILVDDIDIDPKIFRYILNFLRQKEMYVNNTAIENYLHKFGIEYNVIENIKIHPHIVLHHEPYNTIVLDHQLNEIPPNFKSQNMSFEVENINIINTENKIEFNSDILFDLGGNKFGNMIDDILLCIDVPVLNPTDNIEYIDLFEYQLIEDLNLIITENHSQHKVLLSSANHYQYIHPIIYNTNSKDYHQMTKIDGRKMKILYQNNLIDINRIIIPLFLFKSKQNSLPIKQITDSNKSAHLIVKTTALNKIIKNNSNKTVPNLPLLNICLIANYISSINTPIINSYIYDRIHSTIVPIPSTANSIYDVTIIPLNKVGFVKDFFFMIIAKDDYVANRIDIFKDELIELEILYVHNNQLILHTRLDSIMMNSYIPLKKLGHTLPLGVYYHSFVPSNSQSLGGLWGKNYVLKIKTKKMNGIIKFYATEYLEYLC